MSATTIRPCPFCGDSDPAIDEIEMDIWAVCCNLCGAVGPHQSDDGLANIGPKAIELWNKRDSDDAPDPLSQALNEGDGVYRP